MSIEAHFVAVVFSCRFEESVEIEERFPRVAASGGLKPQTAVKSAGVVVGRVDAITFDDKTFQARVTLALQDRYLFPKDSSLKILTSGLLGEQYIGIEAGADDKNLGAGDQVSSTQSAVVLENLIGQFLYNKASDAGGGNGANGAAGTGLAGKTPGTGAPAAPLK